MEPVKRKKIPPIWLLVIIIITFFLLISIGITLLFKLPFIFPIPRFWGILIGIILLSSGFFILICALKVLTIKRAFGKELYKSKTESKLITTGIYNYTRNPLYLGAILLFFGWTFIFLFTFLLIMTFLFIAFFYFVAKWEEKELFERFGEEYQKYKKKVKFYNKTIKTHSIKIKIVKRAIVYITRLLRVFIWSILYHHIPNEINRIQAIGRFSKSISGKPTFML